MPNRYNPIKTSGSNTFISRFKSKRANGSIVEKTTSYNWINYKAALVFTAVIGLITYIFIDVLFF